MVRVPQVLVRNNLEKALLDIERRLALGQPEPVRHPVHVRVHGQRPCIEAAALDAAVRHVDELCLVAAGNRQVRDGRLGIEQPLARVGGRLVELVYVPLDELLDEAAQAYGEGLIGEGYTTARLFYAANGRVLHDASGALGAKRKVRPRLRPIQFSCISLTLSGQ